MKLRTKALLASLIAGLGMASPALAQKAEVIHWWTSGGESAAVKQLAEAYTKAGGTWVDNAIAGGDVARAAALNRIAGGNPPAVSQFNTSKQYLELVDADLLSDVDAVAAKEGWDQWMPTPIKNVIKIKGHYQHSQQRLVLLFKSGAGQSGRERTQERSRVLDRAGQDQGLGPDCICPVWYRFI